VPHSVSQIDIVCETHCVDNHIYTTVLHNDSVEAVGGALWCTTGPNNRRLIKHQSAQPISSRMERITFVSAAPLPITKRFATPHALESARCSSVWGLGLTTSTVSIPARKAPCRLDGVKPIVLAVSVPAMKTHDDSDKFAPLTRVLVQDVMQLPISVERFWSAFDDYYEIQRFVSVHKNTRREPGAPENGVGAQVSFDFGNVRIVET
jgi:hypothetical protein